MRCVEKLALIVVVLSVAGSGLVACGKKGAKGSSLPGGPVPKEDTGTLLHDSLPEKLAAAQKSNKGAARVTECEKPHLAAATELVAALDARSEELATFDKENSPKATERSVGEAKFNVFEREKPEAGWKERSISWKVAIESYAKLKEDKNPSADWIKLRDEVRTLVESDRRRLVLGHNLGLDKDAGAALEKARKANDECLKDQRCDRPAYDAEDERFLLGNPVYAPLLNGLGASRTHNGKRAYVSRMALHFKVDAAQLYEFSKNSSVTRSGDKELTLKLDPGTAPEGVKELLEEGWKSDDLALRIAFEKGAAAKKDSQVFKLEVGDGSTTLDESGRIFKLGAGADVKRIQHEVGHLLGLRDRRYVVWVADSCGYTVQTRPEDLMSVPETGSVLAEDWKTLKEVYKK